MSLRINIEISLAENESPNAREQAILDSMAAHPSNNGAAQEAAIAKVVEKVTAGVAAKTPATAAKAAQAEAPKAAPAPATRPVGRPKAAPKPEEVPLALDTTLDEEPEVEAPEEEVEEAEEDLMGGEAGTTYTKADAIQAATKLVSSQKQAVVKAALAVVGAKRVSDLNDDADIQAFMAALEG